MGLLAEQASLAAHDMDAAAAAVEGEPGPDKAAALRRQLAQVFLQIGWPATLVAVALIVIGGFGIALTQPYGLGRSRDASYRLNEYIDMRPDGNAAPYLKDGWAGQSENGRMTTGVVATVVMASEVAQERGLALTMLARPVFAPKDDAFWVDVLIDGEPMGRLTFARDDPSPRWRDIFFSGAQTTHMRQPLHVTLVIGAAHPAPDSEAGAQGSGLEIEMLALRN